MDKQIRKLKSLVDQYLHQDKDYVRKILGKPSKKSDDWIWSYNLYHWGVFRDEIAFIFEEEEVVDIVITRYFLWVEYLYIYYQEYAKPEYRVIKGF